MERRPSPPLGSVHLCLALLRQLELSSAPVPIGPPWLRPPMAPDLAAASTGTAPFGLTHLRRVPGGPIYTSTNSGVSWSKTTRQQLGCVTPPPADGAKLAAASYQYNSNAPAASHGSIFTSANAGGAWTQTMRRTVHGPRLLLQPTARSWWPRAAGPFTPWPTREGPGLRTVWQAIL